FFAFAQNRWHPAPHRSNRACYPGKICPKMPLASQTDTLYLLWKIVSHFKTVMTMRDFFLQLFITLICCARWT
ncbi:hypothetical protein FIB90_06000, partial [Escherichia coli]